MSEAHQTGGPPGASMPSESRQQVQARRAVFAAARAKKRRLFGLPGYRRARQGEASRQRDKAGGLGIDPFDYDRKYDQDTYGQEFAPGARVWKVYMDEAEAFDVELTTGWNDTVDVLLVFAGLFSAVVATLLGLSIQAIQPDYALVMVALLVEQIAVQRAVDAGTPAMDIPPSPYNLDTIPTPTSNDRSVNLLWFASLVFSLSTALLATIIKQWIHRYRYQAMGPGSHMQQVIHRQFRWMGLRAWGVPAIIGLLPTLLHISLFLFMAGLAVFLAPLDRASYMIVVTIAAITCGTYLISALLPLAYPSCPYTTPISTHALVLFNFARRLPYHVAYAASSLFTGNYKFSKKWPYVQTGERDASRFFDYVWKIRAVKTNLGSRERKAVEANREVLQADAISWLHGSSTNPTVANITLESLAGLPIDFSLAARRRLRDDLNLVHEAKSAFIQSTLQLKDSQIGIPVSKSIMVTTAKIERLGRSCVQLGAWMDGSSYNGPGWRTYFHEQMLSLRPTLPTDEVSLGMHILGYCSYTVSDSRSMGWASKEASHATLLNLMTTYPKAHPALVVSLLCYCVRRAVRGLHSSDPVDDEITTAVIEAYGLIPPDITGTEHPEWALLVRYLFLLYPRPQLDQADSDALRSQIEMELNSSEDIHWQDGSSALTITLFCNLTIALLPRIGEDAMRTLFEEQGHLYNMASFLRDSLWTTPIGPPHAALRRVLYARVEYPLFLDATESLLHILTAALQPITFESRPGVDMNEKDAELYFRVMSQTFSLYRALQSVPSPSVNSLISLWTNFINSACNGASSTGQVLSAEETSRRLQVLMLPRNLVSLLHLAFLTDYGTVTSTAFAYSLIRLAKAHPPPLHRAWAIALKDLFYVVEGHDEMRFSAPSKWEQRWVLQWLIEDLWRLAGDDDFGDVDLCMYERVRLYQEDNNPNVVAIGDDLWEVTPLTSKLSSPLPPEGATSSNSALTLLPRSWQRLKVYLKDSRSAKGDSEV